MHSDVHKANLADIDGGMGGPERTDPLAEPREKREALARLGQGPLDAIIGFSDQDALGITRRDRETVRAAIERSGGTLGKA